LKILQVGKYYPPVRGGIEQHFHLLSRGLARDHDVTALVFNTRRPTVRERIEGVDVVRVGSLGKIYSTEIAPAFLSWMRNLPAEIAHLHVPNPVGELGLATVRRSGPLVVTYHSDVVRQRGLRFLYGPILDAVLSRADRIIVSSSRYMETSETLVPYGPKCTVIPLGLDLDDYAASPAIEARAAELRRRHGNRIVLFVGRLVYYKGVEILLKALRSLDAVALIAGDGPMRARWELIAAEEGVAGRAVFLGEVTHEEKVALFLACRVFVLPATHRSEAFGLVQVEAQACRRPVVSTQIDSGVPFVNQHGVSGVVVPPSDAGALARAIGSLLDDPALALKMGEAGRDRAEREFSVGPMVARTAGLYQEIAKGRAADARATPVGAGAGGA
jgi:rhamnosyl/mannosyltransferase